MSVAAKQVNKSPLTDGFVEKNAGSWYTVETLALRRAVYHQQWWAEWFRCSSVCTSWLRMMWLKHTVAPAFSGEASSLTLFSAGSDSLACTKCHKRHHGYPWVWLFLSAEELSFFLCVDQSCFDFQSVLPLGGFLSCTPHCRWRRYNLCFWSLDNLLYSLLM
jgi:hypothetical protein